VNVSVGRYLIYGLIDPRNRTLRYIGKTHKRREKRLEDHIRCALQMYERPVYRWIRELLDAGYMPEIFVWKRLPPTEDWRVAEKEAITFWRDNEDILFPYLHPPQTPKSSWTVINGVDLLNQTSGG
jgi:hypothetical protein